MASFGMWRPVALVRTDASEKCMTTFIRVTRIGERGAKLEGNNKRIKQRIYIIIIIIIIIISISTQRASVASYY
jgi:hypothetical protein